MKSVHRTGASTLLVSKPAAAPKKKTRRLEMTQKETRR